MQENEIKKYKDNLQTLAYEAVALNQLEYDGELEEHLKLMTIYKIKSPIGKLVYESLSDEDLCEYIRKRAKELGYVPTQKEVHWIYRMYIKKRFVNWPRALKTAVSSAKAGRGGDSYENIEEKENECQELLKKVKNKAEELHRPPHLNEMKEAAEGLKCKFDTWAEVLEAAGINQEWKNRFMVWRVVDFSAEEERLLDKLRLKAEELGRAPLRKEVDEEIREKLKVKCGTWRNTLHQIDMLPIEKSKSFSTTYLDSKKNKDRYHSECVSGGLYKVTKLKALDKENLKKLRTVVYTLDRSPIKEELPEEVYRGLMDVFGSYKNVLYQIGREPLDKEEAQKVKRKLKK